jgi:hypothetical protein
MSAPPPESAAVEEVRAYLATLRGGAPFLSGRDGHLLVTWLEAGVSVGAILRSLDRASAARRAKQIRAPLSLSHARVYLKQEMKGAATSVPDTLCELVPTPAQDDPLAELLVRARAAIAALTDPEPEARARAACAIARAFFDQAWEHAEGTRSALLASAKEELGALADSVPEHEFITVCEDLARFRLRERYPSMSATRIWEQCGLGA